MSEENIALARRAFDTLARRDIDGFLAIMDPAIEFTAARSGMPLEQTMWQVAVVRDGLVTGWRWYRTEAEARTALGLPEQRDASRAPAQPARGARGSPRLR